MRASATSLATSLTMLVALFTIDATAQRRRRFEPTDLELQPAGTLELDSQISFTEGETAGRVIIPDVELSLGIAPNVNIEIDTAYAIEGPPVGRFAFDHPAPDNLWFSSKLGLAEWRNAETQSAWALGAQLGPKVPLANGARGVGYETVFLIGRDVDRTHLVLNAGGFVDPSPEGTRARTTALEGGLDLDLDLDGIDRWSLLSELGFTGFFSGDAPQAHLTAGFQCSLTKYLDLSLIGLLGLARAGDRGGVLFGITPRVSLWE